MNDYHQSLSKSLSYLRPVSGSGTTGKVRHAAATRQGAMNKWVVKKINKMSERLERETLTDRAVDVAINDPNAASAVDSMAVGIVGTGLTPQSAPPSEILGWDSETTSTFQRQQELAWNLWTKEADAKGRLQFWELELLSVYNLLMKGEFFRQPVMLDEPHRLFSLAIQTIDPERIQTPPDKISDKTIHDGIKLGRRGNPTHFYARENNAAATTAAASASFKSIPAWLAHRPAMLHGFVQKFDEQVRGVSPLAPALKLFKDLGDYYDFELIGAIVAASFPVFIETTLPEAMAAGMRSEDFLNKKDNYQEMVPGQVAYGGYGQRPHVLKNERPNDSFAIFTERLLRSAGAAMGIPYEVIAKDFSKTNFASARAALLEAWRVFSLYQKWLVGHFSQPCWNLVQEEAYLRGIVQIPKGSPDFYEARQLYTMASWRPQKRGHVDPKKEIEAAVTAMNNNIMTLSQVAAEYDGEWDENIKQRAREKKLAAAQMPAQETANEEE